MATEHHEAESARGRHLRLEWIESLLAYRHWHTIAEASRRLGTGQDLLSERIHLLEEWFGHHLFERSQPHHRLTPTLTPLGERYLPYLYQVAATFDDLQAIVAMPAPHGQIVVALPESLATNMLAQVRRSVHDRGILPPGGWRFITARSAVVRAEVIHKRAALGLLVGREPYSDPDLAVEPIARSPMCAIAAPDHPLVHATKPVPIEKLGDEVIVVDKEHSIYRAIFEGMLHRARVNVQHRDAFSNIEAVKSAVAVGPGVGMLPYFTVAEELRQGRLGRIRLDEPTAYIQILLAHHPDETIDQPALRELYDEFRRHSMSLPQPDTDE
jgi:DNA-binding transcriptional LysR family regulator